MVSLRYWFQQLSRAALLACILSVAFNGFSQSTSLLRSGFQQPPHSARPVVWWHWVNGNVTKEGITKDLEWMKRAGIGGFQAFDVSIGGGQEIEKKVGYMTPEWLALIRHTAAEAERLGLDMTMVTAAGWSETGGTWVKLQEAMKKLVWSQTQVNGGKPFAGSLPQPPSVSGPIRDMPKPSRMPAGSNEPTYYRDQLVLAYQTPEAELNMLTPTVTNHKGEQLDASALPDDNLISALPLDVPKADRPVYLQFEYPAPFTARTFSLVMGSAGIFPSRIMRPGYVQVSQDEKNFQTLFALPGVQHDIRALPVRTFSFPEVTARYFRVVFVPGSGITTVGGPDEVGGFGAPTTPPVTFAIAEVQFSAAGRVEDKAAFAPMFAFESLKTPALPASASIKRAEVIDLTSRLKADGKLDWNVPPGNWTILRMGYSLTGAKNGPAQREATGLEVDKLSKEHLQSYMRQWTSPIAEVLGPLYGKSLKYFLVDSYEADAQNWTDNMLDEFKTRRGYDMTRYLPVLAGRVVESAEVSDRFLWDFRLTLAEMLVDNHYAPISEFAHQHGIKTYGEVAGISLPIIQDALRNMSWAEQARPFVDYLSRNQFMLQEGRFVADVAYYLGEDIPAAVPYWKKLHPEAPEGYDYDFVNTEILNRFTVENGELVLPSGMRYRVLVLPDKQTVTLPVLKKIAELVRSGAIIVGPKPDRSPSLVSYPAVDGQVATLANEVWGGADGRFIFQQPYGKGQVFWNAPLAGIFGQMGLKKDVAYTRPHTNTRLTWIHRRSDATDYYFLLNGHNQAEDLDITFRLTGKKPERWNADKGTSEPLSYTIQDGLTTVRLHLEPQESVFMVFSEAATQATTIMPPQTVTPLQPLTGSWVVQFPANSGAPAQVSMPVLSLWANHPDEGVKYFSGTATYTKEVDVSKTSLTANNRLLLDLGVVKDIAVVRVNGVIADTLWKAPYVADVTKLLKPGKNKVEILVTNQWDNRIIGDTKAPATGRVLAEPAVFGRASRLKESGLLGPVVLKTVHEKPSDR